MMGRDAVREYLRGSLWVLPTLSVVAALVAGSVLSLIDLGAKSPLVFQGTADDARALLIGITGTMVTVIALLLGLTVVALQLSSTQFSPRLLRNFLRDRPNQIVLSVFVGTFAYSAAGLYTVGVSAGTRSTDFPRLAVAGALVLLFASLAMLVFFADHLAHSIQIDAIMRVVERNTLAVIEHRLVRGGETPEPTPERSTAILARRSGYVQAIHPAKLVSWASAHHAAVRVRPRVGEHVVAGTTVAWAWSTSPSGPAPAADALSSMVDGAIRIGFERTFEQDAAIGIRQLVDIACKTLSPAVNDPYTAVQAIDHLSVIFCALATRPLGAHLARDGQGVVRVVVPGRRFGEYLSVMCGLVRRYGAREPTVVQALLRLLDNCAASAHADDERTAAVEEQAALLLADAERSIACPADLADVRRQANQVLDEHRGASHDRRN
jgi:uncharacterized membrane protein